MGTYSRGVPGVYDRQSTARKNIFVNVLSALFASTLGTIDGSKTRDTRNTPTHLLLAGLLLGKITSSGKYANSILGLTNGAYSSGTSLTIDAAAAVELVRRVGSTGTFKVVGPASAGGAIEQHTVTYSAVDTSTGVCTITALGTNEVQTLTFGAAATGGTMRLRVPKANGEFVVTDAITWNATDATWLSNINTALDAATGVSGGIVATGAAPDTALTFTFSGTGYAAKPQPTEMISVETFPTSVTTADVVRTTAGVGRAIADNSLVCPTDGSHVPVSIYAEELGVHVQDEEGSSIDQPLPRFLFGGDLDADQIGYLTECDASCQAWIKAQLRAVGTFTFDNDR